MHVGEPSATHNFWPSFDPKTVLDQVVLNGGWGTVKVLSRVLSAYVRPIVVFAELLASYTYSLFHSFILSQIKYAPRSRRIYWCVCLNSGDTSNLEVTVRIFTIKLPVHDEDADLCQLVDWHDWLTELEGRYLVRTVGSSSHIFLSSD